MEKELSLKNRIKKLTAFDYIIFFIFVCVLFGFISNVNAEYIPHPVNTELQFSFSDDLAGACNVSTMNYPKGMIVINQMMDKNGNTFNATIKAGNFTVMGTYCFNLECSSGSGSVCRAVSQSGETLSSANSMLYVILIIISFGLFLFFIIMGFKIDGGNYKDEEGIINVNNKKYLKMGCFFMAYILVTWFLFNLYTISYSYLQLDFMSRFFWFGWVFLGWGLVVIIPSYFIFNIVWLFVDSKWRDMWQKQIPALDD
jgi:hypothetical protein